MICVLIIVYLYVFDHLFAKWDPCLQDLHISKKSVSDKYIKFSNDMDFKKMIKQMQIVARTVILKKRT